MAEFCRQCAEDLGFGNDFAGVADESEVLVVLCEGCGPTNVDKDGTCVCDCERRHAALSKQAITAGTALKGK